jgi:transcriptional regulator with XRE-family HTH domain
MAMFTNLGRTLSLLRELRGKSQARVAREAGIGKSQLSKYENGKELPKLDSLEKVLIALKVGYSEFFYTLHMVDRRASELELADQLADNGDGREAAPGEPLPLPSFLPGNTLLDDTTDQAFSQVFTDLLLLYRRVFEQIVLPVLSAAPAAAPRPPEPEPEPEEESEPEPEEISVAG